MFSSLISESRNYNLFSFIKKNNIYYRDITIRLHFTSDTSICKSSKPKKKRTKISRPLQKQTNATTTTRMRCVNKNWKWKAIKVICACVLPKIKICEWRKKCKQQEAIESEMIFWCRLAVAQLENWNHFKAFWKHIYMHICTHTYIQSIHTNNAYVIGKCLHMHIYLNKWRSSIKNIKSHMHYTSCLYMYIFCVSPLMFCKEIESWSLLELLFIGI